jgi:hypothetical protein
MKKFSYLLFFVLLSSSYLLSAQVKGFKTSKIKVGASFQASPLRVAQITTGASLDIVGFEGNRPTWYAAIYTEGGSTDASGYDDEKNRKDSFLGIKGGFGVGSVIIYGTIGNHNLSGTYKTIGGKFDDKAFDFGAGFKTFLGKSKGFTFGAELSSRRILGLNVGFLL